MVKYRRLLNQQKVAEASDNVAITIESKCPKKWAFVDMETGDVWVHCSRVKPSNSASDTFCKADKKAMKAIQNIVRDI